MILSDKERQAPTRLEETEPSHLVRYKFAMWYVNGETVLDAGCGTGYGVSLLSTKAKRAFGVDISNKAIRHAMDFFYGERTSFMVGDMEELPQLFHGSRFLDVVVSFEAIEHIKQPERFLDGVLKVLKDNGTFIVSTPRKPHGSPYHIREYSLEEYTRLLESKFRIRGMFGQTYTDIFNMRERVVDPHEFDKFNFIAVCHKINK